MNGGGAESEGSMMKLQLDTRDPPSSLTKDLFRYRVMRVRFREWIKRHPLTLGRSSTG